AHRRGGRPGDHRPQRSGRVGRPRPPRRRLRGGGLWLDRRLGTGLAAESKQGLRAGILSALLRGRGRPRTATAVTVTRGIDDLDDYFTTVLPALSAAAVVPVVLLVRIVFSDVLSAVIVAVCLPLVPLFMVLIGRYT